MGKFIKSLYKQITFVCYFINKQTNDKLLDKQTVDRLRKTACPSVFPLKGSIYTYLYI